MVVVADVGLKEARLVEVARVAGVSVGLVQRYFRTKEELIRFGVGYVYERTEQRAQEVEFVMPVRGYLERLMAVFLPLDEARVRELRFWLAFLHTSLTDPELAATHQQAQLKLLTGLREAFEGAQRRGEVAADRDPTAEAAALVAFVDGLALHHLTTAPAYPVESLQPALTTYLDQVFG
nr:TetR family transcriptional regulator C-terminal domain-containing protein [Kribbella sandramycini]